MISSHTIRLALRLAAGLTVLCTSPWAAAQMAACSSDGQPRPLALYERFISADCEHCWNDPGAPAPGGSALVLDWIVPTAVGDEAPLAAAATRDALTRLEALGRTPPQGSAVHTTPVAPAAPGARPLRVALGPAVNDYVGASLQTPLPARSVQFWLALVEAVPAGTEGSPIARNLVRNLYSGSIDLPLQLSKKERPPWSELRPMRIPEGAQPERLRLVGWLQTSTGEILAAAQSACQTSPSVARTGQ